MVRFEPSSEKFQNKRNNKTEKAMADLPHKLEQQPVEVVDDVCLISFADRVEIDRCTRESDAKPTIDTVDGDPVWRWRWKRVKRSARH